MLREILLGPRHHSDGDLDCSTAQCGRRCWRLLRRRAGSGDVPELQGVVAALTEFKLL
jgi:hypothetical protein